MDTKQDRKDVGVGQVVKLRTWLEGNQNQAVTGTYLLGAKELNDQVQATVLQMKVGEKQKANVVNKISQQEQTLNIEFLSVQKQEHGEKNLDVNTRADALKKDGNNFIKQKKYDQAISSYEKAFQLIEYCCDQQAVEIRLSLLSNLALATLNSNRLRECLQWCKKHTLESLEPNKKVVYREISAYKGLREWHLAKQQISKALNLWKEDPEAVNDFKSLKQAIEKQQKIQVAKQKKVYSNMFG